MFVDDPQRSVNLACGLVEHAIDDLTAAVRRHQESLPSAAPETEGTGTEQLRQALLDYRSLLDQLGQMSGQLASRR